MESQERITEPNVDDDQYWALPTVGPTSKVLAASYSELRGSCSLNTAFQLWLPL